MASTSETGHAKNVAGMDQLHAIVTAMGADYNPARADLTPDSLQALRDSGDAAVQAVSAAERTDGNMQASREIAFDKVSPILPRILSALRLSKATPQMLDDAAGLIAKIRGARRGDLPEDPDPAPSPVVGAAATPAAADAPGHHSVSQQSFDAQADSFIKLVKLVVSLPGYATNEADITTAALQAMVADMNSKNKAKKDSDGVLYAARIARDKALYFPQTGLTDIAADVKDYLRTLTGGTQNAFYKKAAKIKFRKPARLYFS